MILTQRGVLPPVNFLELDATLRSSILGPSGTRLILPADCDPTLRTTGNWATSWTGFSAPPSNTLNYIMVGGIVYVYDINNNNITGTSNATSMQINNVPAAIRPSNARTAIVELIDNSNIVLGRVRIDTVGNASFILYDSTAVVNRVSANLNNFTNSGSKGLSAGFFMAYAI
jgi:hypothetical protein